MLNITWIIKTLQNIIFKMTEFRAMFRELSSWYKWLFVKGFCGQRTFSRVSTPISCPLTSILFLSIVSIPILIKIPIWGGQIRNRISAGSPSMKDAAILLNYWNTWMKLAQNAIFPDHPKPYTASLYPTFSPKKKWPRFSRRPMNGENLSSSRTLIPSSCQFC